MSDTRMRYSWHFFPAPKAIQCWVVWEHQVVGMPDEASLLAIGQRAPDLDVPMAREQDGGLLMMRSPEDLETGEYLGPWVYPYYLVVFSNRTIVSQWLSSKLVHFSADSAVRAIEEQAAVEQRLKGAVN